MSDQARARAGVMYGIAAYGFWGIIPIFWKQLSHVSAVEILSHRIAWGLLAFAALCAIRGRMGEVKAALTHPKTRNTLVLTGALLACNWLIFIHAVNTGRVLQASLGYFMTPLVSVLLGVLLLRERLARPLWAAVSIGALGVVLAWLHAGSMPWMAVVLAVSFGIYGLLRKTVRCEALPGSTVETLFMLPFGLAAVLWIHATGEGHFAPNDPGTSGLLFLAGPVTALPLLWFSNSARRVNLTTVGFLQYLAPSFQFFLAVLFYDEHFGPTETISFACVWVALVIFTITSWQGRARRPPRATGGDHRSDST